jgi:hypothetical protein
LPVVESNITWVFRKRNTKNKKEKINFRKVSYPLDKGYFACYTEFRKSELKEMISLQNPVFDYSKLRGRIREICGTQDAFADAIGLGRVSVSQRLNNHLEFSQKEMIKAADVLLFPHSAIPEYFLREKVQKHEQE